MSTRSIGKVAVAGALALPFLVASPASAATLPERDTLYALSCDSDFPSYSDLYRVDPQTADLTYVGGNDFEEDCAGPAAFDPTTGSSYYLSWSNSSLAEIDVATGGVTLTPLSGELDGDPDGIAIGPDGQGWLIHGADLYRIDLETAETTFVVSLAEPGLYSLTLDPTDGQFYAVQYFTGNAYRVSVPDGELTLLGTVDLAGFNFAMQIDTSGRWWLQVEGGEIADTMLWSTPRPDGATELEFAGDMYDSANEYPPHIDSLLLTSAPVPAPEPQLAATGVDSTPLVAVGAALAALGAAFATVAARRRRSA